MMLDRFDLIEMLPSAEEVTCPSMSEILGFDADTLFHTFMGVESIKRRMVGLVLFEVRRGLFIVLTESGVHPYFLDDERTYHILLPASTMDG